jgi:hypothetical protein
MPSQSAADDSVSHIRAGLHWLSGSILNCKFGNAPCQELGIGVRSGKAVVLHVPYPDLVQLIERGWRADDC